MTIISEPYIQNKKRPTDTENKQGTKGESQGVGTNQEFRININTLLYIKQISNKNLLFGTWNYTQYFVITYKEKASEKKKNMYN